jgi:predicted transposase YdaD
MRQARKEGRKQGLEEGREAGRQEGREAGRQEGRLDGQRRLLENLLRLKFGELDVRAQVWLESADEPALQAASGRVLTATTLAETLG